MTLLSSSCAGHDDRWFGYRLGTYSSPDSHSEFSVAAKRGIEPEPNNPLAFPRACRQNITSPLTSLEAFTFDDAYALVEFEAVDTFFTVSVHIDASGNNFVKFSAQGFYRHVNCR